MQQKQLENEAALLLLPDHLAELDGLSWNERQETAAKNLLAGNVFDWGAKEAAALMQVPGFGFQQALDSLQSRIVIHSIFTLHSYTTKKKEKIIFIKNQYCFYHHYHQVVLSSSKCSIYLDDAERPWFIDHVQDWLARLQEGPYRCAAIFVDNSGLDVILGVLPFARELLNHGTKVSLKTFFFSSSCD